MSKLEIINDNVYRKTTTGADYNRPTGVLKDEEVTITGAQEISRIVPVGFMYESGINALEVYVNGVYKRANAAGFSGDYTELSRSSVQFEVGEILEDNRVRFRLTSAYYRNRGGLGTSGSSGSSGYGFTWKGPWVTAFDYYEFDVVENNGTAYVAIIDHNSSALSEPGVGADSTAYWDYFLDNPIIGTSGSSGSSGSSGATAVVAVRDSIGAGDWTASGGRYYCDVPTPGITDKEVVVQTYEDDFQILPADIEWIDDTEVRIWMPDGTEVLDVIILG